MPNYYVVGLEFDGYNSGLVFLTETDRDQAYNELVDLLEQAKVQVEADKMLLESGERVKIYAKENIISQGMVVNLYHDKVSEVQNGTGYFFTVGGRPLTYHTLEEAELMRSKMIQLIELAKAQLALERGEE